MRAVIYDGHSWQDCTLDLATAATQDTSLSWIDIRVDGPDDPAAPPLLSALGVDAASAVTHLKAGPAATFVIGPEQVAGVAWLAGSRTQPTQAWFTFDGRRLVTLRTDGDAAFTQVQAQLANRADLAIKQPTRIVGFVLQAMLMTVQQELTDLAVQVGVLDLDIITATGAPSAAQSQQLVECRQAFQPFAMRYPSYLMAVNSTLIDPDSITALDPAGVAELQTFASLARATESMVLNIADSIRNTVQDLQGQVASWQGNRINQLTVVTVLFLPITFLTGYFGMNFAWIDNLLESAPAYLILGLALPIGVIIVSAGWLARRGFRLSLGPSHDDRK
jgi:Mg2+ and Co2+ transporter CorA